jgi:hypothetical protein
VAIRVTKEVISIFPVLVAMVRQCSTIDRNQLDLINDGKQALQLIHPDRPKLNYWGNHA